MTTMHPARGRLALALDVDDLVVATRLARQLAPWFGTAKVGLELFSASGPEAIGALADLGFDVFLDVKLHDIPTTVTKAAACSARWGCLLTLHATGGEVMLRAGVDGLAEGARERAGGADRARRDDPDERRGAPPHILPKRVAAAIEAGCGGIVCAAADFVRPSSTDPGFLPRCRASARRAPTPTTRPGRRRRLWPSPQARTCWWWGER